ncbi:MAG: hypothetical protein RR091_09715 [Cloacibacillus sp.]
MEPKVTTASEDKLGAIHQLTAEYMFMRLMAARSGEIILTPAELSSITKFLKDNAIECTRKDIEDEFSELARFKPPQLDDDEILELGG